MDEVVTENLSKHFGETVAVDGIDMTVPQGAVFGLLGPNGAGKSTTVRLLCTLLRPTSGGAVVAGHNILEEPVEVRRVTGVLPEEGSHTVYPSMTVYENLEYFARLYGLPEETIPAEIERLLKFMELWERRDDRAGELSTGNRQRLALCRALIHRPRVLLLDEPTASLDPIAARRVRELILRLSKEYQQTFFINSHNLAEVQRVCDHIAIIDNGKILLAGPTDELRKRLRARQVFRIRVYGDTGTAEEVASTAEFVHSVERDADCLLVTVDDPVENNSRLMRLLLDAGVKIVEFAEEEATLEDLYLQVVRGGGDA